MTADEVRNTKNGDAIQKISGKVLGVYKKDQTPGQKKVGIFQQDVQIVGDDGSKIKVVIMNETMHLPKDAVGRVFSFECSPGENGKPSGVYKNEWNGFHSVQVQKDGIITGDKASKPTTPPVKQLDMTGNTPPTKWTKPDAKDHVHALVDLMRMVEGELVGTTFGDNVDLIQRMATTVYIQACKEGLISKREAVPQAIVQMAERAQERPAPEATTPAVSDAYIIGKAAKGQLTAKEVSELHATGNYDWEKLYDQFEKRLIKDGYDSVMIGEVYDNMKAVYSRSSGKYNNADFCRMILSDPETFIASLNGETEVSEYRNKDNKKDDDIPF